MKVLTLDSEAFAVVCREMAGLVAASRFSPQLIVGIRRGGEYVAREMARSFPLARLQFVELQRPSTKRKSRLSGLLRRLPLPLLDLLRMAEAKFLSLRRRRPVADFSVPGNLCGLGDISVLLVDDAVDSGVTMRSVADALRRENPAVTLRTAALTVTTSAPEIMPDFVLHNSHTLLRFPWSMDAR